jgi:hypothetical protein
MGTLSTHFSGKNAQKELEALKAPFSRAGLPIMGPLLHDFDRQNVTLLTARQAAEKRWFLRRKQPSAAKAEFITQ